ncbi:MAG: PVC-type heme-binding CxxCH protein [Planctomycetales bacterium]
MLRPCDVVLGLALLLAPVNWGIAAPPLPRVPAGFEIEVAAEFPIVERPVMACFDERGRLYLVDSAGVNEPFEKLIQNPQHRIVVLEDTDGDGQFDKRTLFADKLAMPQGVLPYRGAVYTASPPSVWKLEDTNGDGVCDKRTAIVSEFGSNGNGADIHGPFLGPDGWLYLCDGRHGHKVKTDDGTLDEGLAGGIFRFRPDGSGFQRICGGGFDNPVEIDFTDGGEILGTVNILHVNPRQDCLMHWVEGAVYPHGDQEQCIAEYKRTGDLMLEVKAFGHVAVSGMMRYRSEVFGPEHRNNLFITFFNRHQMIRSIVERSGATFTSREEEFLVSEEKDFHPTDVLEDADGSLLVINTGGWFRIGCPVSEIAKPDILGAIYRIRKQGVNRVEDPRGLALKIESKEVEELIPLLGDARPAVRERVMERLRGLGRTASRRLSEVVQDRRQEFSPVVRRAAWAALMHPGFAHRRVMENSARPRLEVVQEQAFDRRVHSLTQEERQQFQVDQLAAIHAAARDQNLELQLLGLSGLSIAALLNVDAEEVADVALLHELLVNGSPPIRREVATIIARRAMSLPKCRGAREFELTEVDPENFAEIIALLETSVPPLFEALRAGVTDRVLEHALIYALIRIDSREATIPYLKDSHPQVRRAALISLDQMDHGHLTRDLVAPLLDTDDPALRKTALQVISSRKGWATEMVGLLREWLGARNTDPERLALLRGVLTAQAADQYIQQMISASLDNPTLLEPMRLLLWEVIDRAPLGQLPDAWLSAIERSLTNGSEAERSQIVALIQNRGLTQFDPALLRIANDERQSVALRVDALSASAPRLTTLNERGFSLLTGRLTPDSAPLASLAAARGLADAPLTVAQLRQLATSLPSASPLVVSVLLRAFAKADDPLVGTDLVLALQQAPAAENLSAEELAGILRKYPSSVQKEAGPLLVKLGGSSLEEQRSRLAELSKLLEQPGDAARGKALFFSKQAACSSCHTIGNEGGRVGPDLSRIGGSRGATDLLEAIVFPSATFAREFRPYVIATDAGKVYTGIISRQTADAIHLRTADLAEVRIPRAAIEEMRESNTSIMPKGLEAALKEEELRDLVAYLQGLK